MNFVVSSWAVTEFCAQVIELVVEAKFNESISLSATENTPTSPTIFMFNAEISRRHSMKTAASFSTTISDIAPAKSSFTSMLLFCCVLVHRSRWSMDVWKGLAISEVDFAFALSPLTLAINAWQFLCDEFYGRSRRTADPTRPSVYSGLLAHVGDLSAAATLSLVFFVFSPCRSKKQENCIKRFPRTREYALKARTRTRLLQRIRVRVGYWKPLDQSTTLREHFEGFRSMQYLLTLMMDVTRYICNISGKASGNT